MQMKEGNTNHNVRFAILFLHSKWEVLDIMLDRGVSPVTTNKALSIENGVLRIAGQLILSCITNQTFSFSSESNIRGRNTVSLIISNNFHSAILEDTNTARKFFNKI